MAKAIKELELKDVPVSDEVRQGMSLNPNDQQWIKRLLDMQAGAIGEDVNTLITELTKALAQVQQEQNERMFKALDEQSCLIKGIKEDVKEIKGEIIDINKKLGELDGKQRTHDIEIALLKRYSSFWSTALRIGVTVSIAVGITLLIIL